MARITPVHWKTLKCVFEQAGFAQEREESSHISMIKTGVARPVIIPKYTSVGLDIIQNNMRTAGMSREEYFRFLASC